MDVLKFPYLKSHRKVSDRVALLGEGDFLFWAVENASRCYHRVTGKFLLFVLLLRACSEVVMYAGFGCFFFAMLWEEQRC